MKKLILLLLLICTLNAAVIEKSQYLQPRKEQNCDIKDGWFWYSEGGHCDYCNDNCSACNKNFMDCSTCMSGYGMYQNSAKANQCKKCGDGSKVLDCCWQDSTHEWGFNARQDKCAPNTIPFGHYCMTEIPNCIQYSKYVKSANKDSAGYTRCHICADGYYLDKDYKCSQCKHSSWEKILAYNDQTIPLNNQNAFTEAIINANLPKSMDKDGVTQDNIINVCVKCNQYGTCSKCSNGYYLNTNNVRETFDKNISRSPSICQRCNYQDQMHEYSAAPFKQAGTCYCDCKSPDDLCESCKNAQGAQDQCWKDTTRGGGCRPCSEIFFKYKDNAGTLRTVNIGTNCLKCGQIKTPVHENDIYSQNMQCLECVDGAIKLPFYNNIRKEQWGFICIDPKAFNKTYKNKVNPSLDPGIADSDSSPFSQQLRFDSSADITTIERAANFTPDSDALSKNLRETVYSQKYHFTVPNCHQVEYKQLKEMKDTTTGSKEPTYSYVLYVPSCVNCDNGFTDYTKKFVFKEKIKEPVVETEYKYNETDIKICRECSIVIKERDDKYLTGVTHENYKLVRRCKTTDQADAVKQYEITQCSEDNAEKIENYPVDQDPDIVPAPENENKYRGSNKWYKFNATPNPRVLQNQVYLVKTSLAGTYNDITFCVENKLKCSRIKQVLAGGGDSTSTLQKVYQIYTSTPYCEDCYKKAQTTFPFVKTQMNTCKLCEFEGCTTCEAKINAAAPFSDDLMCVACQNNQPETLYRLSTAGLEEKLRGYGNYQEVPSVKNYYEVKNATTKEVTCTRCTDVNCKECTAPEGKCKECQAFYILAADGSRCNKCWTGSWTGSGSSSVYTAGTGVQHCKKCDTSLLCLECMEGYTLMEIMKVGTARNYVCDKCEVGCKACQTTSTGRKACKTCETGYYLSGATCQKKRTGCTNNYNTSGECVACQYGYTLISGGWCYDCLRQQYNQDGADRSENPDGAYNYLDLFGFVHCPWDELAKNCKPTTYDEENFSNVRRIPKKKRILEILDDIFE